MDPASQSAMDGHSSSQDAHARSSAEKRRLATFFLICIPFRIALAVLAWWLGEIGDGNVIAGDRNPFVVWLIGNWTRYGLAIFTGLAGLGMILMGYLRSTGRRANHGFAGGEVYWNSYAHGTLYLLFTVLFLARVKYAYLVLVADVIYGVVTAVNHYF